jgi:hypothetical protein
MTEARPRAPQVQPDLVHRDAGQRRWLAQAALSAVNGSLIPLQIDVYVDRQRRRGRELVAIFA